jgi:hypothetical protein
MVVLGRHTAMRSTVESSDGRRGQALVELALVLPVVLLLLIGLIEFGRAWNIHQVVTDASREGARQLVLPAVDEDSARIIVRRALASGAIDPDRPGTQILPDEGVSGPGSAATVEVRVPYNFVFLGPIMSWFTDGWGSDDPGILLTARSVMRNEE